MAGSNINVNLTFNANTKQAKAQMRELQQTFNNLATSLNSQISLKGLTTELQEGYQSAKQLQYAIQSAVNTDTGKLDLTKFNRTLNNSGKDLKVYAKQLSALGPEGKLAFSQMASAIASAEVPLRKTNMLVDKLWASLKNVATWQISSSVLMGFTGAISDAYNYAHDLNGSLNDIRIVTGQNIDQMAKFADKANKAAKALSTTTKEYSKASLIYFQQGLSDADVKRRTDITVKMANVTGTTAQEVSDQMTAVWNNFYDGSKSLEYYADVMTALGAATASSTDEISEGLNKFAAVAETVGLSYEYSASALATLTATTRESADIVGNALKTLFARIQGLRLGETLEDGVTLNKYSTALEKVGISILDANGNMKEMDTILNELGNKWDTISKAEQTALAQTVAGVRQYTQLIALMENWDYFQENLGVARGAEGALQEQADIYAESWEAAEKRVQASAEAIYQELLNDEFFIDLTNMFGDLLDIIKSLIDSMGGVPGLLGLIGTVVTKFAGDKIISSLSDAMDKFSASSARMREESLATKQTAVKLASDLALGDTSQEMTARSDIMSQEHKLKLQIFNIDRQLSEAEQQKLADIAAQAKIFDDILISSAKIADEKQREVEAAEQALKLAKQEARILQAQAQESSGQLQARNIIISNRVATSDIGITEQTAKDTLASFEDRLTKAYGGQGDLSTEIKEVSVELNNLLKSWGFNSDEIEKYTQKLIETVKIKQQVTTKTKEVASAEEATATAIDAATQAQTRAGEASQAQAEAYKRAKEQVEALKNAQATLGTVVMNSIQSVSSFAMALSSLTAIIDVWNNDSLSGWEKFTRILTSIGFTLPMLINGWKSMRQVLNANTAEKVANALATWGQVQAENALQKEKGESIGKTIKQTAVDGVNTAGKKVYSFFSGIKTGFDNAKDSFNQTALDNASNLNKNKYRAQIMSNWKQSYGARGQGITGYINKTTGETLTPEAMKELVGQESAKMAGKDAFTGLAKGAGKAALTIGVVVAALALAKKGFEEAQNLYNKDKIAAEEAEETYKRLAESYEEASGKYDNLKNSISSYNSSIQGLSELKTGTLEYADAVSSANEQALNLIDTYNELAGQYQITSDGLIVFNEQALRNVQMLELQKKNAAQTAAMIAKSEARKAQTESNKTNFARNTLIGDNWGISKEDSSVINTGGAIGLGAGAVVAGGAALTGALAGTKFGAALGTFAGPIGTAIGAAAGAALGLAIGGIVAAIDQKEATENEKKSLDAIYELYDKIGDAALTPENISKALQSRDITDPDLINSLDENRDELRKLMAEMKANTEALKAETQALVTSQINTIDSNFVSLNEDSKSAIATVLADRELDLQNKKNYGRADYAHDTWGTNLGWWYTASEEGQKLADEWGAAQGLQNFKTTNFGKDTIKYEYYDKTTGKTEKKELDYDDLAAWQEGKQVSQDIADNYEKVKNQLLEIGAMDQGEGLLNVLAEGNLYNLSKNEFNAFKTAFESGEFNEELKSLGEFAGKDYAQAVEEAIRTYDPEEALAQYAQKINGKITSVLAEGAKELEISEGALENYAKALMKNSSALSNYGDEWEKLDKQLVAAELAVANAKFAEGVKDLNEVLFDNIDILNDWNEESLDTWEAVSKVQDALEGVFGVRVSADYVKENLIELQKLANGNVEKLDELREAAAKDYIVNLDTSQNAKDSLLLGIDNLLAQAENQINEIEIGVNLNDSDYISQLNKMLETGELTADEVKNAFSAIGYSVDVRTTKKQIENTTHFQGSMGGQDFSGSYTTYTTMDVPYIAGEGTADPVGVESKVKGDEAHFEQKESGSGFTYRGGTDIAAGALNSLANDAAKKTKKLDIDDEIDRYHEIKEVISDIERELDALGKAKNRAFGADKLRLMDKEIAKNKELLQAQKDYVSQIEDKFAGDRDTLLSFGASTDSEGRITNYEELRTNWINQYNSSMQNVAGDSEKEQEIQNRYDAFTKAIDQYEESLNLLESEQQKIIDLQTEIFDQDLEKIEYKVEIKTELADDEIKWLEYELEHIEDLAWNAATAIAKLGDIANQNVKKVKAYHEGLAEVFKLTLNEEEMAALMSGDLSVLDDKTLTEGQIEVLKNYRDALYDSNASLEEFYSNIEEQSVSAFEIQNEEMEKSIAQIEHLNSTLETYVNIVDLVGKKNLGLSTESLRELGRAQVEAAQSALRATKTQLDSNKAQLLEAQEQRRLAIENNASEETIEYWDNIIETIGNKVVELEETVNDQWVNTLQAAADDFERAVDTVMESFEESMSGIYGSFDAMEEAYNQQKEISERYLADYEQIYNLSKLNRDISKSINDTDSIRAKSRLRDIQEEINALQESNAEMTQYEVDELRARYELRLAEIALEDAQNAKSQVRMQRDAEGNWSYVYTADQNKVDSALQNYEDKLYAYQQLTQGYIDEMEDQIIGLPREYADKMREIASDVTLTEDERKVKMQELTDFYSGKYRYLYDELNKALGDSKILYQEDWNKYSEYTGYKIALDSGEGGWRDSFNETALAQITGYGNIETARSAFNKKVTEMLPRLGQAFKDWQADVDEAMRGAGKTLNGDEEGSFKKELETTIKNTNEELGKVESSLSGLGAKATQAFQDMVQAVHNEFDNYEAELKRYKKANEEIIQQINKILTTKVTVPTQEVKDTIPSKPDLEQKNNNGKNLVPVGTRLENKSENEVKRDEDAKTKNYSVRADKMNREDGSVDEVIDVNLTYNELKNLTRSNSGWGAYSIIKNGVEYQFHSDQVRKAMTEAGLSSLYKERNYMEYSSKAQKSDGPPWQVGDTITFSKGALSGAPFEFKDKRGRASGDITYTDVGGYQFTIVHDYDQYGWVGKTNLPIGWPYFYIWKTDLEKIDGFNTGGYTGSWGTDGRLAMLHQKELVLNADDTTNFLSAIQIIRDISRVIDLRAAAQTAALSAISSSTVVPSTQTLEQQVTIHAEFPNATNRTEIEAAFDTLVNRASQFANRKK